MKRILITLVSMVSLAAQAPPAAAVGSGLPGLPTEGVVCFIEFRGSGASLVDIYPVGSLFGVPVGMRCIAFGRELVPDQPPCGVCYAIFLDYGAKLSVQGHVAAGFEALERGADVTARDWFLSVARVLPDDDSVIRDVGIFTPRQGEFVPTSQDWLRSAGTDINAGLQNLAGGRTGEGLHRLDQAYLRLSTHF